MACGHCPHTAAPAPAAPLMQIRQGHQANWNGLAFTVENESNGWALRIQDSAGRELYRAHRLGLLAAQVASAEYAIVCVLGPASSMNAARLSQDLHWQPYW